MIGPYDSPLSGSQLFGLGHVGQAMDLEQYRQIMMHQTQSQQGTKPYDGVTDEQLLLLLPTKE